MLPHLILFWTGGCKPCSEVMTALKKYAAEYPNSFRYLFIKSSDQIEVAKYFKIITAPTLIEVDKDLCVRKFIGPKTYDDVVNFMRLK